MADGAGARSFARQIGAEDARVLRTLAEAATPSGQWVRAPGPGVVDAVEEVLQRLGPLAERAWLAALRALDLAALPLAGARLSSLPLDARMAVLVRLADGAATDRVVRLVTMPLKLAQVLCAERLAAGAGAAAPEGLPVVEPRPRWMERCLDAREMHEAETLEADVVLVGSGAGAGPVARALAREGLAVVLLEEGGYFSRSDFHGAPWARSVAMMRQRTLVGNAFIAMPTGVTVGGSTTVNSGTCLRPSHEVFRRWRFEHGLAELDPEHLEPYFARVEATLEVDTPPPTAFGGCARVIARGAAALGWSHGPLRRNAPGCDAQGHCCFGCPTEAKRSVNVTYVPDALRAGAVLVHHARVEEVLRAGGRAVGVVARATGGGAPRIRVLAKTVVLAAGAIGTPSLLLRQGIGNGSGQVGRNLTVHLASSAWAEYDERIDGQADIPQGWGVDEFAREGIHFEGVFVPRDIAAATLRDVGPRWTEFVDRFERMASFGFMTSETSRGRVRLGPGGSPLLTYHVNDFDRRRMLRGHALLARLFLAGGAREVRSAVRGFDGFRTEDDVLRLERAAPSVAAHRLDLAGFHPLGTCRMGRDPARSVVGPTHESHDVPGLFVVDGSSVNGPLGANPQVTIMALAERASAFVSQSVERATRPARPRPSSLPADAQVEFTETMRGRCALRATGREVDASFTVRVGAPGGAAVLRGMLDQGGAMRMEGVVTIEGLVAGAPCYGTLSLRPLRREGTLVYDLRFEGDDGVAYNLHGEKSVRPDALLSGMTTLATEVARVDDGVPVARGTLRFELGDLPAFLATWRVRPSPAL